MAEDFCKQNSCGLTHDAICRAIDMVTAEIHTSVKSKARYKIIENEHRHFHFYEGSFAIQDTKEKEITYLIAHCHDKEKAKEICVALNTAEAAKNNQTVQEIKTKFSEFIANQKDVPSEFVQIVNDNFWKLV
jgi:hypothetical protein